MYKLTAPKEKVSTVGIRNQVTLPKQVRERVKTGTKRLAYIQAREKEDSLFITLEPPTAGTYNKIKISEKGQLVIPKNLRESKDIREGTNLVFSVKGEREIMVQKLIDQRKEHEISWRWSFLVEIIKTVEQVTAMKNVSIEGNSLVLSTKKELEKSKEGMLGIVSKMETLLGSRLMVEKLKENKIRLTVLK